MKDKLFMGFLRLCLVWVIFALCFDMFMIFVHFTNPQLERDITNELTWRLDGTFKNNPKNIWYKKS